MPADYDDWKLATPPWCEGDEDEDDEDDEDDYDRQFKNFRPWHEPGSE